MISVRCILGYMTFDISYTRLKLTSLILILNVSYNYTVLNEEDTQVWIILWNKNINSRLPLVIKIDKRFSLC